MSVQWIFLFLQSGGALYVICNYWADYCCLYYHSVLKKSKETADQAVNDAIVPGVMNALFDDVQDASGGAFTGMLRDEYSAANI